MPPNPTLKQLLLQHIKDFKNFQIYVENRFYKVDTRLDNIENDVQSLKNNVLDIQNDLKIIKSVPIIKQAFKKQK